MILARTVATPIFTARSKLCSKETNNPKKRKSISAELIDESKYLKNVPNISL